MTSPFYPTSLNFQPDPNPDNPIDVNLDDYDEHDTQDGMKDLELYIG